MKLKTHNGQKLNVPLVPLCPNLFIVVNIGKLTSNDRKAWKRTNTNRFDPAQTGYLINVFPDVLQDEDNDAPGSYITWLRQNQYLIDFKGSSAYFRCGHALTGNDIEILQRTPNIERLTLSEFKQRINDAAGDDYFSFMKYDFHVRLFRNGNAVGVQIMPFARMSNCFSFPLLRDVSANDNRAIFEFKEFIDENNNEVIVFVVTLPSGRIAYYDISHIPPFTP